MSACSSAPPPPPPTYIFREHKATVNYVCIFDSDKYMASCDADGWIVIWRLKTRRVVISWKAHADNCLKIAVSSSQKLISQGRDSMLYIWKLDLHQQPAKAEKINSIAYNDVGFCKFSSLEDDESEFICFASMEDIGFFGIFDVTQSKWIIQSGGEKTHGACMAVEMFKSSGSLFVLVGYENGEIALWEINEGESRAIWRKQRHKEPNLTRSYFISSSADNRICQQSLMTGDVLNEILTKKSGVPAVKIRHDNKIFATGGYDGKLRVFSIKKMKPLAVLSFHRDTIYSIDFGTQSNWLVGASQDNRISLWNIF
ncbi:WD40-repeat-containing domain protein [Sporodiniella umbellata]|nr:WD40-repeat-containing domain protein [Sporodiniella umbellata]